MTVSHAPQQAATPVVASAPDSLEQVLQRSLQLAVQCHQSGQMENAETLYRAILQAQPQHAEANFCLGRLAVQVKQAQNGLPHFASALQAEPQKEQYWLGYIDALMQANEIEPARQLLALGRQQGLQGELVDALAEQLEARTRIARSIRDTQPSAAPAQAPVAAPGGKKRVKTRSGAAQQPIGRALPSSQELGKLNACYKQGRLVEAKALARALTLRFPGYGFGWKMLGVVIRQQGGLEEALQPMQSAAKLLPDDAETHRNLGMTLSALGRQEEAEASFRRSLEIAPTYAEAHLTLSVLLKGQGRLLEAQLHCRRALEINPLYVEAHWELGAILKNLRRMAEAEASYQLALQLAPGKVDGYNYLGMLLLELGRWADAEAIYRRALEIDPAFGYAYTNLGIALNAQGRQTEAEVSYRRALQLQPDHPASHSSLLYCLSLSEGVGPQSLFAEHCRFGEQFEAPLRALWRPHDNPPEPRRQLQIGFVSGDLHHHAVASFIEPVFEHLAGHVGLALHAYSNHTSEDHVSQRLRGHVRRWHTIAGLSDAALAEKIRADGIDILIDLSGHTAGHRLLTFARKPAPLQVSWMGYPGTTGLSSMDYYLSDRFLLPPGQFDSQFTEKLVHLPANAPFLPAPEAPPVNQLPALSNGHLTFGSFNRQNKLSRAVIALWSQLLRAVPSSRMVLGAMPQQESQYDTLIGWFADEGIARQRLSFYPRSGMQDYLALHHQVDICLDTFPYNGGTTTLHALWMGVPTLTLAGATVAGRTGAGILGHLGLDEFIVPDDASFVAQGLWWTDHWPELARLRCGLRERFAQSAIGQPALIAAGLERALRCIWQGWCAGLPAASFEVSRADLEAAQEGKT